MPKKPNSRRNLDMAIRRAFGNDGYLNARTLIANTVVTQMLPDGVVKGGSALKMRLGDAGTRFTSDLDTAAISPPNDYADKLGISLETGWNGFSGTVDTRDPAHPKGVPQEYVMRPFDVKLSYLGQPWCTVRLEVGYDEIGDADVADTGLAEDILEAFERVGLPSPQPVPLMTIPYQIAQKLHGVSTEKSERARDLVDLQLIVAKSDIDYVQVRRVCRRLFAYRRLQSWPPVVIKGERWDEMYKSESEGLHVLSTADGAVVWVNDLIATIESAGATVGGAVDNRESATS